jgi:carbamoyltransferase
MFSPRVKAVLGDPRIPHGKLTLRHEDLAASLQEVTEEIFFHLLKGLHKATGEKRLCLAGGVALNCVMNGKIEERTPFRQIYLQADAGDGGTSLGGALYHHYAQNGASTRTFRMDHVYWGPQYGPEAIEVALVSANLPVQRDPEICVRTAQAIADGKIVGWYQGRMEVGPRALGNRSILADPRNDDMKHILNSRIKRREFFRPFAPSVLEEHCGEWFDRATLSPFMLMNYVVRPERRKQVPGITHVDGTARVQTVSRATNPRYWDLINEFFKRTGVPLVLNTSFNEDEPIVCTPAQAIDCFRRSRIDLLALGDYWVSQ